MLTREEIILSFKKVNFPEKIFNSSTSDVKNIIFYAESKEPELGFSEEGLGFSVE